MNQDTDIALLDHLLEFISENKKSLFEKVIRHRTRYLTVALENIYQPHNASAVLRSCDCFGIQDVHIIENSNKYQVNPDVALGSSKWLSLHRYNQSENNTLSCIRHLKEQGYRMVAATPAENSCLLDDLLLDQKTALMFGTEMHGLTQEALNECDAFVKIPMYGFTESLNISVSVAVILHHLTEKLRNSEIPWQLNRDEELQIKLSWARQVVRNSAMIEKRFLAQQ